MSGEQVQSQAEETSHWSKVEPVGSPESSVRSVGNFPCRIPFYRKLSLGTCYPDAHCLMPDAHFYPWWNCSPDLCPYYLPVLRLLRLVGVLGILSFPSSSSRCGHVFRLLDLHLDDLITFAVGVVMAALCLWAAWRLAALYAFRNFDAGSSPPLPPPVYRGRHHNVRSS